MPCGLYTFFGFEGILNCGWMRIIFGGSIRSAGMWVYAWKGLPSPILGGLGGEGGDGEEEERVVQVMESAISKVQSLDKDPFDDISRVPFVEDANMHPMGIQH